MSSGSEELHEGNAFNGDSSEATLSSSPIEVSEAVDELFKVIDGYRDQEQAAPTNRSNEINAY